MCARMDGLFDKNIRCVKGVGDARASLFERLGVGTVCALLRYFPKSYEDWSHPTLIADAPTDQPALIIARISGGVRVVRARGGMTLYICRAVDEDGSCVKITFFNNPYTTKLLTDGEEYVFRGKLTAPLGFDAEMASPVFRRSDDCGSMTARYGLTEGLNNRAVANAVANALAMLPDPLDDPLPADIRERQGLCGLREALFGIHCPANEEALDRARRRLVFDELFLLQLGLLRLREQKREGTALPVSGAALTEFLRLLPFEPTVAQSRAIGECLADMSAGRRPMTRLLQGDVGSGKTLVAAALCFCCARSGLQSALMAPTEILAEQHFATLYRLLSPAGISVRLLTGSTPPAEKSAIYSMLADGSLDIAVGTHALISGGVEFSRLALTVTDEQHRFGTGQRAALAKKGADPHMLVMSATPIPRTLALIIYGDLDVSILDEMPGGRIPIETYRIDSGKRERAYGFIRGLLDEGRQAYIVCPLVDEGEGDLASAEQYAMKLSNGAFSGYSVGLLHGRMKPADKDYTMRRFNDGSIQLLVSTTVVEVGVDVPNAVVMLIENAERFGLSQLHQLRGRVGRGQYKSYCILVSDVNTETSIRRLRTMTATSDGFEIARQDLALRGPGDFFGSRQHGLPALHLADLSADLSALEQTQTEAAMLIAADPQLSEGEHQGLRAEVTRLFADTAALG